MNKYPDDVGLIELAKTTGSLRGMSNDLGVSRVSLTNYLLRRPKLDAAVRTVLKSQARIELADDHKSSTHPDPPNKPGMNWIERIGGHLPPFIKRVAKHIMSDSGYSQQRAIAAAISQCKKGRLGAKGLAAAAQWEALKARAHAHSNEAYEACQVIELATYSTDQLRSYYKAAPAKKTAPKKGAAPAAGGKKRVVRTAEGARRYKVPIGTEIGPARDQAGAAAQKNTAAVDQYKKTVNAGDRDKQISGLTPKDLGDLSRVAFSFKTSNPQVVALRMSVVRELSKRGMDPKQFGYIGGAGKAPAKKPAAKPAARKPVVRKPAPKKPAPAPARTSNINRSKVQ